MSGRIGGWNVSASGNNAIATAEKAGLTGKQHVIFALDVSFSASPAAPVKWEIIASATSPGTVLAAGYASVARTVLFPEGLSVPPGSAVSAVLAAGGSLIGEINLHGITR